MDQSIAYYTVRFAGIPFLIALAVFIAWRIKTSIFDDLLDIVERKEKVLFFSIITAYFLTFGVLSVLRYLSLHSTLLDLGIYDNKIWRIARFGEFSYCIDGHLRPIIILFAPLYMLLASPVVILTIQTAMITLGGWLLYRYAGLFLPSRSIRLIILAAYFLYPSLEYNNLFDYHTDHMIIPLFFAAFYFIEQGKKKWFLLTVLPCLFLKEPLLVSLSGMGIYVIIRKKWWREGLWVTVVPLLLFYVHWNFIVPLLLDKGHDVVNFAYPQPFSHLEGSPVWVIFKPWIILQQLFFSDPAKLGFVTVILVPLLLLPLFSPIPLITALPHLVISILSNNPSHYSMAGQYTASLIPGFFVAMVFTIGKLQRRRPALVKPLLVSLLLVGLYYNVVQSPSPLSVKFWLYDDWYNKNSYVITERDREMLELIKTHIPSDPEVPICTQNTVNHAWLAHRKRYFCFPYRVDDVDYVVLDLKRPLFLGEEVATPDAFQKKIEEIEGDFQKVVDWDGFFIYGRKTIERGSL